MIILGCPATFVGFKGKCYKFFDNAWTSIYGKKSWKGARNHCKSIGKGFDLVVIYGKAKNEFIKSHVDALYQKDNWNQRYWLGLKENGTKGSYGWVDDTRLTFGKELKKYPWLDSEPNQVNNIIILSVLSCYIVLIPQLYHLIITLSEFFCISGIDTIVIFKSI